ncbi:hypothetical protein FWF74_03395 [Candidatus Saccharibacteria bacterium]|nr:hypothetical protein [Candidatus Saccharibacteria bacterium]MCL1962894.1 hypothetical protein [Candidatus Saccharibacteria bacterium]
MSGFNSKNWTSLAQVQEVSERELGDITPDRFCMSPREFIELKQIQSKNPLLISRFRFPTNPNTNQPMVDLERIMVNQKLFRAINRPGMFRGQILSEYSGGGSVYEETINGRDSGGIMAATSIKSQRVEPPEPARGDLLFSPILDNELIRNGFGKPIAINYLNRTAIDERIDELTENPKREMTDSEAWATALDENLHQSIIQRTLECNAIGERALAGLEVADFFFAPITAYAFRRTTPLPFIIIAGGYAAMYGANVLLMDKTSRKLRESSRTVDTEQFLEDLKSKGIPEEELPSIPMLEMLGAETAQHYDEALSPREWRMSITSPMAAHPDSYLAVRAVANRGKLIRYRK